MKRRNFFRYTFTRRTVAISAIAWLVKGAGLWCAYRLQWQPLVWGLLALYGIFGALFLLINYVRWRRYIKTN